MSEPPRPTDPIPPIPPTPPAPPPTPQKGIVESPEELRQRQVHEKEQHDDAKSAAVGAAVGVGCVSMAFLPWLIGFLVFLAILLAWSFHARHHWGG